MATTNLEGREHSCGGTFQLASGATEITMRGVTVEVDREVFRCDGCGEERQTLDQASAVDQEAAARVREELGLLHPEEIRDLRARLDLTQEEFERALGLGAKSMVRWENGTVMQSKAADNLLRGVARDPGLLEHLGDEDGVTVPETGSTADGDMSGPEDPWGNPPSSVREPRVRWSRGGGLMERDTLEERWRDSEDLNEFLRALQLEGVRMTSGEFSASTPYPGGRLEAEVATKEVDVEPDDEAFVARQTLQLVGTLKGGEEAVVRVRATYALRYRTKMPITEELIPPFSELSLSVQTWPFFREFVQSSLARMNWPQLSLPILYSPQRFGVVDFSAE